MEMKLEKESEVSVSETEYCWLRKQKSASAEVDRDLQIPPVGRWRLRRDDSQWLISNRKRYKM